MLFRYLNSLSFRLSRPATSLLLIAATILFCLAASVLHAAPSKKDKEPPIEPSVGYDATLDIHRGDTKTITLRAIPSDGYDVEFQILTQPRYGTLSKIVRNSKGSVALLYSHQDSKNSTADSFKFKIKTGPRKCWSTKTARIQISEPPARLDFTPETLEFGSVFIGESATLPIKITNSGGGFLRGTLIPSTDSYSIIGSSELDIPSGKSKTFAVTFAPKTPDTQTGKIRFESDVTPRAEIAAQGIGKTRFQAPDQAAFDTSIEPFSLRIEIANKTAEPLPISIQATPPLETLDQLELPPNGTSNLQLKIKPGFFTGKFASLLLTDGAGEQSVKIQLPPPPAVLDWEAPNLDLGDVITGTSEQLKVTLHNRGTSPAKVKLLSQGDGILIPEPEVSIPPLKSLDIKADWTFATLGPATATIHLASGADLPLLTFRANVQEPRSAQPSPIISTTTASPSPPQKSSQGNQFRVLSKIETEKFQKRTPSQISYRLNQKFFRADALVFWKYDGPQPVKFTLEVKKRQRLDTLSKPFEDRLKVPDELPSNTESFQWVGLPESVVDIQLLPDGRWQGSAPGFEQGFHHLRIGAQAAGDKQIIHSAFIIEVSKLPSPWLSKWLLGSVFLVCAGYLFRYPLLRLFGFSG